MCTNICLHMYRYNIHKCISVQIGIYYISVIYITLLPAFLPSKKQKLFWFAFPPEDIS